VIRNKGKFALLVALALSMLAPASLSAKSADEVMIEQKYGPESGYSKVFQKQDIPKAYIAVYEWSADFSTTTQQQIKKDIAVPSDTLRTTLQLNVSSEKNTGSNAKFKVELEMYYPWAGYLIEESRELSVGYQNAPVYFYKLKPGNTYRLRINGNVKGSVDVYRE